MAIKVAALLLLLLGALLGVALAHRYESLEDALDYDEAAAYEVLDESEDGDETSAQEYDYRPYARKAPYRNQGREMSSSYDMDFDEGSYGSTNWDATYPKRALVRDPYGRRLNRERSDAVGDRVLALCPHVSEQYDPALEDPAHHRSRARNWRERYRHWIQHFNCGNLHNNDYAHCCTNGFAWARNPDTPALPARFAHMG